ncbi:peptidyl-alpha-hydroxyglycine alpha-amidating lyase 2-like protein [Dinothrombium tinctorium]|uniref:peptidylamidoglycolate lyase n=1 Tax=Dinothrombium tinctorium TaxID=1965070 RepID=A0A3S3PKN5_9ACAR|nr:peptidyl-alpha-hydroxyglycine alpha-amidating lyase 2-like protein [Dinothrombium tinctorium]
MTAFVVFTLIHAFLLISLSYCRVHTQHNANPLSEEDPSIGFAELNEFENVFELGSKPINLVEVNEWPRDKSLNALRQVAGVAATNHSKVYVFHRGDRAWDNNTFDYFDVYQQRDKGPIDQNTILILNSSNGDLIESWGKNMFYMPHGISLDPEGNVWVTDVALHQVFRFKKGIWDKPDLVLGQAFVPGNDHKHFCKPTDVAISSSGIVYISDGYCNSRIVILDANGQVLREIGTTDNLVVPHSLTLLENEDLICVADREQRRVMCYTAGLSNMQPGTLVFKIPFAGPLYAIDRIGYILFGIIGPTPFQKPIGIAEALATEQILGTWEPKSGFSMPHDLSVSQKERAVYVTEIGKDALKKLYKFKF